MRIEQLRNIIEVSQTRSMSKAAKNLYISQPSLSASISALEEELGLKLFNRSSSGVVPTAAGNEIITIAHAFFYKLHAINDILPKEKQTHDDIHLVAIPAVSNTIILEAVSRFKQEFPENHIFVTEERPEQIPLVLSENPDAIGITGYNDAIKSAMEKRMKNTNIISEFLYKDRFCQLVSAKNPIALGEKITNKQIAQLPTISFIEIYNEQSDSAFLQFLDSYTNTIIPNYFLQGTTTIGVTSIENIKRLVAEDAGTATIPKVAIYNDFYYKNHLIVPMEHGGILLEFNHYLLYNHHHHLSSIERRLIEIIKDIYNHLTL